MGKKNKIKKRETGVKPEMIVAKKSSTEYHLKILLPVLLITLVAFLPMLQNSFTNWDDPLYVIDNSLLRGPDWNGIFTEPVVSNYHPLTIISLAFNYAISGLNPLSYLVLNLLLHLVNTALCFYFIYSISGKKIFVAAFTALVFGIHPMHVESVVWVSERKDVLYTFFFLLSLIQYWRFLENGKSRNLYYCFFLFACSLLSKPAAIILPLILLALDYWKGRKFDKKLIGEKAIFFLVAFLFAVLTVKIQSKSAIAGLDFYPLWNRFFFATYSIMIYTVRFFVSYPLSTFHPFPVANQLGLPVLLSPLFVTALFAVVWYLRKNKLVIFCAAFFIINLLLVLQVVSVGASIVSERYTYVPYIGLAFLISMLLNKYSVASIKSPAWVVLAFTVLVFGFMTFSRTQVWKDSDKLWTDVISHYPNQPIPRTNRANHILKNMHMPPYKDSVNFYLMQSLEDCNIAISNNANHARGYENRQNVYLRLNKGDLALADANTLLRLEPGNVKAYYIRGMVYINTSKFDSALIDFNKAIEINGTEDFPYNNRGLLYLNHYKSYDDAIKDFSTAIQLNPQGEYFLNRGYAYYNKGDLANAAKDAVAARDRGTVLPDNFKQALGIQ